MDYTKWYSIDYHQLHHLGGDTNTNDVEQSIVEYLLKRKTIEVAARILGDSSTV